MKAEILNKILLNHIKSDDFNTDDDTVNCIMDITEANTYNKDYNGDNFGDTDIAMVSSYAVYVLLITNDGFEEIVKKHLTKRPEAAEHPEYIRNLVRRELREYPGFGELPTRVLNEAINDKIVELVENKEVETDAIQ